MVEMRRARNNIHTESLHPKGVMSFETLLSVSSAGDKHLGNREPASTWEDRKKGPRTKA